VITLGQTKIGNIVQMITITCCFNLLSFANGTVNCDHIKRITTLTSDNIKRLSLYFIFLDLSFLIGVTGGNPLKAQFQFLDGELTQF
jgi:hypothetical protein